MLRIVATSLLAIGVCALQSGCCCCRVPMFRPPPVVVQAPPMDVNVNPPPVFKAPVQPKHYIYVQSTGQLKLDNQVLGKGYSRQGAARNNAAMQGTKQVGAIPIGHYLIVGKRNDVFEVKRDVIDLLPVAGKCNHFNRFPGELFAIIPEGDPPNNPPNGCLVTLPRNVWDSIATDGSTEFEVVP